MFKWIEYENNHLIDHYGFTWLYFIFLVILIIGIILITIYMQNHSLKQIKKICLISFFIFLFLEIFKQIFVHYPFNQSSYDFSIFPFQLCSIPLYICFIIMFCKEDKINPFTSFLSAFSFTGGMSVMVNPQSVMSVSLWRSVQSMSWHVLMVLLAYYLIINKCFGKNFKDLIYSIFVFTICFIIALCLNSLFNILKEPLHLNGYFSMFYLNEQIRPIEIVKLFVDKIGWTWFKILYYFLLNLSALLIWSCVYLVNKLKNSKIKKAF